MGSTIGGKVGPGGGRDRQMAKITVRSTVAVVTVFVRNSTQKLTAFNDNGSEDNGGRGLGGLTMGMVGDCGPKCDFRPQFHLNSTPIGSNADRKP